jgi:hypothetical protein
MTYLWLVFLLLVAANSESILTQATYTSFHVHYPDNHLKGKALFIRGDNCNLTWNKGVALEHTGTN